MALINLPGEALTVGGALTIIMGIYKTIADAWHARRDWTAEDSADIVMNVALIVLGIVIVWVGYSFYL